MLGWFASVVLGRMPKGLRDAGAYGLGYSAQTLAYLLFVTDRYPNGDPASILETVERPPEHPVHLAGDPDDLRRSRVTVFFRLPLAIPHFVWLALWAIAAVFVLIAQWFVTLFRGTPAAGLHRFLSRFLRYVLHVYAFFFLVANPFPGFTGETGRYPLDLVLPAPARQNRWKTGFRLVLVIPAGIVGGALGTAMFVAAVLTWFVALFRGSAPAGLRNLSAYALRYQSQTNAYFYLVTDAYPHASPLEGAPDPQLSLDVAPVDSGAAPAPPAPGVSRRPVARAALLVAFAAVWSLAAYLLWQSRVPASLHLPHVAVDRYFTAAQLHAAASYGRFTTVAWAVTVVVELVVFIAYARWGVRFAKESAAGPIGTGMLLGMIGFALLWLAELPFDVAALWWERRHHLTHVGYFSHVFGNWLALGSQFVFLCLALAIVMGFARWLGDWWWLPAAPVFVALATLSAFVTPYLLSTHSLRNPVLLRQARTLERIEHVQHTPIVVQPVRDVTSLPNAEATGLGPSRRVVLWDTLLDGRFTRPGAAGRDRARARPSRAQPHLEGRRLVRPVRVPRSVPDRACDAPARRNGGAGGGAARAAHARRAGIPRAAVAERDLAAHGGGGGLDGAAHDARSVGRRESLPPFRPDDARPAEPVHVGVPRAREPSDDRTADRDGAGVEPLLRTALRAAAEPPAPARSAGSRGRSAPAPGTER